MPKQLISADTISDESEFLMSYEIVPLRIADTDTVFRVSYMLPTIPFALPWIILPIVGMCAMFRFEGPMFGSWALSMVFVGLAIIAGIACLIIMQRFIVVPLRQKSVRLVFDKRDKVLALPTDDTTVPSANIHTVTTLHGWLHLQGRSALVSEVSVVYSEDDKFYRSAILLTNKWKARKIAARLCALTHSRCVEINQKRCSQEPKATR